MAKVVRGGNIFFKDDIQIIDSEVSCSLQLPEPPIFTNPDLQIIYNGNIFKPSKNPTKDAEIKVYTMTFGLESGDNPKKEEDKYFSDNTTSLKQKKETFIERVVNGISILDDDTKLRGTLKEQIGSELIKKISESCTSKITNPRTLEYVGKGQVPLLDDNSVLNSEMKGCERLLLLDGKVYDLLTQKEFVSMFQRSMEPTFYRNLIAACESATPEEISKMFTENKDKVIRKVLPMVRNKIWHSPRSFKLFLDGMYFIPQFREDYSELIKVYKKLLEKKVKIDAVKEYL